MSLNFKSLCPLYRHIREEIQKKKEVLFAHDYNNGVI